MSATQTKWAPSYDAVNACRVLGFKNFDAARQMFDNPPPAILGYVTFFDCGLSINLLRLQFGGLFFNQTWYDAEPFATVAEPPRYRQLQMEALEGSFKKTFAEQQALLLTDEEVPSPRVVVMGMVIHCLATGHRLFPDHGVRCIDRDSDGDRVYVGNFDADGLNVSDGWDGDRGSGLGLSAARKF